MSEFKPLPFDCERCEPVPVAEEICSTCERWVNHPLQTWGHWTPVGQHTPGKPGCYKEEK